MNPLRLALPLMFGLGLGLVAAAVPRSDAAGRISLSWDRPAGPNQPAVVYRPFTGPGPVDLYVTLNDMTDRLGGLQVWVSLRSYAHCDPATDPVPPAWRFDAAGCQAGRVCFVGGSLQEHLDPPDAPGLRWISDFQFDETYPYSARFVLAELYPQVVRPDPARTYTIARFRFDHLRSVVENPAPEGQCGGAGQPLWFWLTRASYIDEAGNEIAFSIDSEFLAWNADWYARNDPALACSPTEEAPPSLFASFGGYSGIPLCDLPVPAAVTSWGRLKSAYR